MPNEPLIRKLAYTDFDNNYCTEDGICSTNGYSFNIISTDKAVVATSKLEDYPDDMHSPVLDIDVPHYLIPSSTEGHSHLYIDVPMPWDKYVKLLEVLADCGIIEPGYLRASLARGFTAVRLPHIKKDS